MRKALIVLMVLFSVFLAIGCADEEGDPAEAGTPVDAVTPAEEGATEIQNVTEETETKEYTLEELAEYNGKNGKAYVAYQGQVYDISDSDLWNNGTHKGHDSGKDLTEEMAEAPHGPEVLKNYSVVGTLKK